FGGLQRRQVDHSRASVHRRRVRRSCHEDGPSAQIRSACGVIALIRNVTDGGVSSPHTVHAPGQGSIDIAGSGCRKLLVVWAAIQFDSTRYKVYWPCRALGLETTEKRAKQTERQGANLPAGEGQPEIRPSIADHSPIGAYVSNVRKITFSQPAADGSRR